MLTTRVTVPSRIKPPPTMLQGPGSSLWASHTQVGFNTGSIKSSSAPSSAFTRRNPRVMRMNDSPS